jgi:malonyl-CoA O-methyltransferase
MTRTERPTDRTGTTFGARVRDCFSRGAAGYERGARLQAAMAVRLGRLCRDLAPTLPSGARADLGAGSGLLSRSLEANIGGVPLLRVDQCSDLLAQERHRAGGPAGRQLQQHQLLWDLNDGLPRQLGGAALLASSFTLQWLERPEQRLTEWCRQLAPGGLLVLAVPTAGSFGIWRRTAERAGVPYSGLELPAAGPLEAVVERELEALRIQRLRFSRANRGALTFLREIRSIGAQASRVRRLGPGELRRLMLHWPASDQPLTWEVLLMVGRRG